MFARRLLLVSIRASAAFSSSAPKSKGTVQKVSLFGLDGKIIGVKTKTEAEAIAKKLNVMLKRKPQGHELKEPSYVLYDPKSDFEEDAIAAPVSVTDRVKKTSRPIGVREKKKVTIGATINDHDIGTKARAISKFLLDNCEVQVVAYGQVKNERLEDIYKQFEQIFTGLRFVQKVLKSGTLKFTILPDPDKFTGITLKESKSDSGGADVDPEAFIDDKEVEELVQQNLKEKK